MIRLKSTATLSVSGHSLQPAAFSPPDAETNLERGPMKHLRLILLAGAALPVILSFAPPAARAERPLIMAQQNAEPEDDKAAGHKKDDAKPHRPARTEPLHQEAPRRAAPPQAPKPPAVQIQRPQEPRRVAPIAPPRGPAMRPAERRAPPPDLERKNRMEPPPKLERRSRPDDQDRLERREERQQRIQERLERLKREPSRPVPIENAAPNSRVAPAPKVQGAPAPRQLDREPREELRKRPDSTMDQRRPASADSLPPPPKLDQTTPLRRGERTAGPRNLRDFRERRREVRQGNRLIITEPGRVIVRDGARTIIQHNEIDRFRRGARDVQVREGRNTIRTIIVRPDGSQIINITDREGRLLRRIRRLPNGVEIVIIDNRRPRGGAIGGFVLDLAPPIVRIPRSRYIVEADDADEESIYEALVAPPVMALERPYSLDEVRYNQPLRERMPRVDLNTITFDTGSWDIDPAQAERLSVLARAMRRAIRRNPGEVFLIEGHTDAVGSDIDNLSLSDRRAEAVAELLTQDFGVPAENLTTQGYGEQYLKVPTEEPERANRRVTVRRITPLLSGDARSERPRQREPDDEFDRDDR